MAACAVIRNSRPDNAMLSTTTSTRAATPRTDNSPVTVEPGAEDSMPPETNVMAGYAVTSSSRGDRTAASRDEFGRPPAAGVHNEPAGWRDQLVPPSVLVNSANGQPTHNASLPATRNVL